MGELARSGRDGQNRQAMVAVFLLILSLGSYFALLGLGYAVEFAQGAAATLILLAALTRVGRRVVPFPVTVFGAILLVVVGANASLWSANVVLFAPDPLDPFGVYEHKMRRSIERGRDGAAFAVFERAIVEPASFEASLSHRRNVALGVQRDGDWLRLIPQVVLNLRIGEASSWMQATKLASFILIRDVGPLSISREPLDQTGEFLAVLAKGLRDRGEGDQTLLLAGAAVVAPWKSFAHRAFPLFVQANRRIEKFVRGEADLSGELNCAIREYERALRYVRPFEGPGMRAAILNNLVLAQLIQRELRGRPQKRGAKKIVRLMREALRLTRGAHAKGVATQVAADVSSNVALVSMILESKTLRRNRMKRNLKGIRQQNRRSV